MMPHRVDSLRRPTVDQNTPAGIVSVPSTFEPMTLMTLSVRGPIVGSISVGFGSVAIKLTIFP